VLAWDVTHGELTWMSPPGEYRGIRRIPQGGPQLRFSSLVDITGCGLSGPSKRFDGVIIS